MGVTFDRIAPDHEVHRVIREAMEKYHPALVEHEVKVDAIFAYPYVKLHGVACAATVKKNSLELRVKGHGDAEIKICKRTWEERCEEENLSTMDHELQHLSVVYDLRKGASLGSIKTDDIGRPLLKMRPHDVEVGWFKCIAERHGKHSYEVQQALEINRKYGQLLFRWADEQPVEMPDGATLSINGKPATEGDLKAVVSRARKRAAQA